MLNGNVHQLLGRTELRRGHRIRVAQPRKNLQIKFVRPLSGGNEFVAYVDAIGKLDGRGCLLEWKTTSARYSEQPDGLLALDPQLLAYSWITGISEVAQVVFVRKRLVETQYLHTTITDEQRREFVKQIQSLGIPLLVFVVTAPNSRDLDADGLTPDVFRQIEVGKAAEALAML